MSILEQTAIIITQMSSKDTELEGALMAAFDLYSLELQKNNSKIDKGEIFKQMELFVGGIIFRVISLEPKKEFMSGLIKQSLKEWWRIASMNSETLWDFRP